MRNSKVHWLAQKIGKKYSSVNDGEIEPRDTNWRRKSHWLKDSPKKIVGTSKRKISVKFGECFRKK